MQWIVCACHGEMIPIIFLAFYFVLGLCKDGSFNLVVNMIFKCRLALISCEQEMIACQQLGLMNHPFMTLTQNKTLKKLQGSFLYDFFKRSIDCEFMLHCYGKLNFGVKLDFVACFALFYRVSETEKRWHPK